MARSHRLLTNTKNIIKKKIGRIEIEPKAPSTRIIKTHRKRRLVVVVVAPSILLFLLKVYIICWLWLFCARSSRRTSVCDNPATISLCVSASENPRNDEFIKFQDTREVRASECWRVGLCVRVCVTANVCAPRAK